VIEKAHRKLFIVPNFVILKKKTNAVFLTHEYSVHGRLLKGVVKVLVVNTKIIPIHIYKVIKKRCQMYIKISLYITVVTIWNKNKLPIELAD